MRALLLCLSLLSGCSLEAMLLAPNGSFDPAAVPAAPDYSSLSAWAAHPDLDEHADLRPPGEEAGEAPVADVFFLHPTTFFARDAYNGGIGGNNASTELLEQLVLAVDVSPFNDCCRVFAPRYRQATIGTFYASPDDGAQAFGLAGDDLDAAFDAFLQASGDRPFLLAAHSQGSMHAMRLLERIDADPALRERFVAAYLPGIAHPLSQYQTAYPHLSPCSTPEQTGCVAAWDTYREGASTRGPETLWYWQDGVAKPGTAGPVQCTNPVSWSWEAAPKSAHLGAVGVVHAGVDPTFFQLMRASEPLGIEVTGLQAPRAGLVSTRCGEAGFLFVDDLADRYPVQETTPGNYHLLDVELFGLDVRRNAVQRAIAWTSARGR